MKLSTGPLGVIVAGWFVAGLLGSGTAPAMPLVAGNTGGGSIDTFNFGVQAAPVASFTPDGAGFRIFGRGIAIRGNEVFYTEVFGSDESIHVAPFNSGAGGADIRTLPNPARSGGVQDLAFFEGSLYAMTGYTGGGGASLQVWKLNPVNGVVLGGPINITAPDGSPHDNNADGFTVLPNGNFLINDGDGSVNYREYSSTTGRSSGFSLVVPGSSESTGVDTDGIHLFFSDICCVASQIVETDLLGNLIAIWRTPGNGQMEDIAIVPVPEPSGISLLGIGLAVLGLLRWRAARWTPPRGR